MTKNNKNVDENPDVEVQEQEVAQEAKVNAPKAKVVEVRYLEDGSSIIANVPYKYRKDTTGKIPADVAAILVNSGVAIRL